MNHSLKTALLFTVLLQSTFPAAAQNKPKTPDIPTIADTLLYSRQNGFANNASIIGASLGIYWKGKTYYYSYGWADREKKIKVDTNTLFEIGSNTKVFTGLMLASEIAEGKMKGDDLIDQYVHVNPKIQRKVRLTDIANHISGLPTFHDSASLAELIAKDTSRDPLLMITDDFTLSVLQKTDSLHEYGSYEYSNLGVGLLGYILQKAEGASYEELLQRMICSPLQLKHMTTKMDTNSRNLAKGYCNKTRAPYISLVSTMQGAGAIKSDITDMMRFIRYQLSETGPMQKAKELSHRKYYNGKHLQIAMGWHVSELYGAETYEMRGDTYGASSLMQFCPEHELGIVVLLNSTNSGVTEQSMQTIMAKLFDTTGSQNRFALPEKRIDRNILDAYAGIYELQPGFDAMVSVDNGKLALQLTGQPKSVFKAVEDNWFVFEQYNCQLEFIRDKKGACHEFILHQNAQQISCKRKE